MIITITEQNAGLYNALFAKAYQELEAAGRLKEEVVNEEKRFLSLDDYFAHMADLLALNPAYMMLPIDEAAFTINANTRTISTPKVVTLQNDQIAETLMFTVDRYFDYMDLYNARVFVQWTLPSGKEGATEIELKDITTTPGKIRFGWPLDSEVTSEVGTVKYSVRFWQSGEIDGADKVVYSFNTLTSSINISPSLQPTVNSSFDINKPVTENLFKRAIFNSQITNGTTPIPLAPSFSEPGLNLPVYASLNSENTLTLKAQAVVGDTGTISYEWYYKPAVSETIEGKLFSAEVEYPYSDYLDLNDEITLGFRVYGGTVNHNHFEEVPASELKDGLVLGEMYYVEADGNPTGFAAYDSHLVPSDGTKLYQRFTTYTVPTGTTKVTGEYCVRAVNSIRSNESNPQPSQVCRLVSPDDVTYTTNLAKVAIIPEDGKRLAVRTNDQTGVGAAMTYTWTKSTADNSFDDATTVQTSANNYLDVTTPGWYRVDSAALLNRETKNIVSDICKATFAPAIPTMDYTDEAKLLIPENGTIPSYSAEGDVTLVLNMAPVVPEEYTGYATELFSEKLTYTWKMRIPDVSDERVLGSADISSGLVKSELGKPQITVNADGLTSRVYTCYVTNELNGQVIESDSSNSLSFLVV